jgi:hypothetical protein
MVTGLGRIAKVMQQRPHACIDHCIAGPPFEISSGGGRKGKKAWPEPFSSHVTRQWRQRWGLWQSPPSLLAVGMPRGDGVGGRRS